MGAGLVSPGSSAGAGSLASLTSLAPFVSLADAESLGAGYAADLVSRAKEVVV